MAIDTDFLFVFLKAESLEIDQSSSSSVPGCEILIYYEIEI